MSTHKVTYTTSIDKDIKREFKLFCAKNNLYQNEVIEKLLIELISGNKDILNLLILTKEGENVGNTD